MIRQLLSTPPLKPGTCDVCAAEGVNVWNAQLPAVAITACRGCWQHHLNTSQHLFFDEHDVGVCLHWGLTVRRDGRVHVSELRRLVRILRKYRRTELSQSFTSLLRVLRLQRGGRR